MTVPSKSASSQRAPKDPPGRVRQRSSRANSSTSSQPSKTNASSNSNVSASTEIPSIQPLIPLSPFPVISHRSGTVQEFSSIEASSSLPSELPKLSSAVPEVRVAPPSAPAAESKSTLTNSFTLFETIHVATQLLSLRSNESNMTRYQASALERAASSPVATETELAGVAEYRRSSSYSLSTQFPTEPGAYQVIKHRLPGTVSYQIRVPPRVKQGHEFEAETSDGRRVQVVCPEHAQTNDMLEIAVTHPATYQYQPLKAAQLTASPTLATAVGIKYSNINSSRNDINTNIPVIGGAFLMIPDIQRINEQAVQAGGTVRTHVVAIPSNVHPGQRFRVQVNGNRFHVVCPETCRPGSRIRIVPPPEVEESPSNMQTFAVQIPHGVVPGGRFTVMVGAHGRQQVLVECPISTTPGQTLHIQLPTMSSPSSEDHSNVQLTYPSGSGWIRTIRASDMKFQWVRVEQSVVDDRITNNHTGVFDFGKSAYVRKLVEHEGNDPRLRTATITLATAEQAVVDSKFKTPTGVVLFSYADIIALQRGVRPTDREIATRLSRKHQWFLSICQKLTESVMKPDPIERAATLAGETELSVKLLVRREHLLHDSIRAVLSLSVDDMRRKWEIEFVGELGFDRGGLTREWFECVTDEIFHPKSRLFVSSVNNQAAVDINPSIGMICPDNFLQSYRFVGRVIGRGLFTGNLIRGHFVRLLYKHLLGWPTTHEDVKDLDHDLHTGLLKLTQIEDVSAALLDFTATEDCSGSKINQDLIVDGSSVAVTNDNIDAYIEHTIRYRTFNRILPQLTELLLGFYDVIPEAALTIFDVSELELILCGLPSIDTGDWQANTLYSGLFQHNGSTMSAVRWFWDVVENDFDDEMKARLLQFATGTSGVNLEGFANLQGSDGSIMKFSIHGVDPGRCFYPKSHTCFNQLDLPNFTTRALLKERLTVSITTSYVGFDTK